MKKVTKDELINLLKNKNNHTFKELAEISGYHQKYLIRLNKELKRDNYKYVKKKKGKKAYSNEIKYNIINDYLTGSYKSYKDFYNENKNLYDENFSYSLLCKILSNVKTKDDVLFIMKYKKNSVNYLLAIDYQNEVILYSIESENNDLKSFKRLFHHILLHHGTPKNICFVECCKKLDKDIIDILEKYNVHYIPYKNIYRHILNTALSKKESHFKVQYQITDIDEEDFCEFIIRKTIGDNLIQFKSDKYMIKSFAIIKKNKPVILYYNSNGCLYIKYRNIRYEVIKLQV